jgi:hypothetical protein
MSLVVISLVSFLIALLGVALLILALVERRRRSAIKPRFIPPIVPFLPGSSAAILGIVLTLLGGGGDYAAYKSGNGITPLSIFKGAKTMTLTGTIELTRNWAQLNVDSGQALDGQPIQGPVILMMQPGGQSSTDQDRINAAFQYFGQQAGVHYTLTGIWQASSGRQFFLVQQADKI